MSTPGRSQGLGWYGTVPVYVRSVDAFAAADAVEVPRHWIVYLSDVQGSTKAIEAGRYRDVNTAGCLPVMALANHFGNLEFPFIFGGDGMTLVLPPEHDTDICAILRDTRTLARSLFGLELRLGRIPLVDLVAKGARLALVCQRLSDRYRQAVFFGDALDQAEEILKTPALGEPYRIQDSGRPDEKADFTGFSCRWKDIPSPQGLTLALLVRPGPRSAGGQGWVGETLRSIAQHLGPEEDTHPVSVEQQVLAPVGYTSRREADVVLWRDHKPGRAIRRMLKRLVVALTVAGARIAIGLQIPVRYNGLPANKQRETNRANADVRKFDGALKLIVATSPERSTALEGWLAGREAEGLLVFGLHRSDRALMTCMVHSASSGEVHFVDCADGGYAMAARMLKGKLRKT